MGGFFHPLLNPAPVDLLQTSKIFLVPEHLCLKTPHSVCAGRILVRFEFPGDTPCGRINR